MFVYFFVMFVCLCLFMRLFIYVCLNFFMPVIGFAVYAQSEGISGSNFHEIK